jgi:hypothetical protein
VFQAFFVSYLVEPGYGKAITTLDEAVNEGLLYGKQPLLSYILENTDLKEFGNFPKSHHFICTDHAECMERVILQRNMGFVITDIYATYIASILGVGDYKRILCHVKEGLTIGITGILHKGSLYSDRLNTFLRRCGENGMVKLILNNMVFKARLQSSNNIIQDADNIFFAFKISHLCVAFTLLISGWVLSGIVFIFEIVPKWVSKRR